MAHFAEINCDNIVVAVHYVGNETILDENGEVCDHIGHERCIEHSENCRHCGHRMIQTSYSGKIRSKYAGIGDYYDEDLDVFISPKLHDSFVLDATGTKYVPPIEEPTNPPENYDFYWDEERYNSTGNGWRLRLIRSQLSYINGSFTVWDDDLDREVLFESPVTQEMLDAGITAEYDDNTGEWTIIEPTHLLNQTEQEILDDEVIVEPFQTELIELRRKYIQYLENNSRI